MDQKEAIAVAVKAGDVAKVEALLREDPALIGTMTPQGSLVVTAIYNGHPQVGQVLLRFNPSLDLFEAATVGSAERLTALLLENPGGVNAANADGFRPLHVAAFYGHAEAAQVLLAGGAEINRIMQSTVPYVPSNTPLHAAIAGGPHRKVVEMLVGAGADVNALDSNGHTPLHSAAFHQDADLIGYLLAHGAAVNAHAEDAPTPLGYALQRGKEAAAAALRAAGGVE